ncbi:unnamed protein product [Gadus morhua 'NCC']
MPTRNHRDGWTVVHHGRRPHRARDQMDIPALDDTRLRPVPSPDRRHAPLDIPGAFRHDTRLWVCPGRRSPGRCPRRHAPRLHPRPPGFQPPDRRHRRHPRHAYPEAAQHVSTTFGSACAQLTFVPPADAVILDTSACKSKRLTSPTRRSRSTLDPPADGSTLKRHSRMFSRRASTARKAVSKPEVGTGSWRAVRRRSAASPLGGSSAEFSS